MRYAIMCGGTYSEFSTPRQLTMINGEEMVRRTIRLLRENGIDDIVITATDPRFDNFGVPRLIHQNRYKVAGEQETGYWLDAFYPFAEKVTYIFGDVCFTADAIKTIVNYQTDKDVLFGTSDARNKEHQNWGEPFAYIVNDIKRFHEGVKAVKRLYDEGKLLRNPLVWELYRYLNGLDVNVQSVLDETFICIDDGTMDIDDVTDIEMIQRRFTCY